MSYGYNGFGKAVQDASTRWMFAQIKKKIIPEYPARCDCCGQTEGKIGYHAESYARPFGPHIVAFDVCHLCHVIIHADRGKYGTRLKEYVAAIENGYRFRNFNSFNWAGAKSKYLNVAELPLPVDPKLYPSTTLQHDAELLHRILSGQYKPTAGTVGEFYAPDHKKALFDGVTDTQQGFSI